MSTIIDDATITGTSSGDNIKGTDGDDIIVAGGGRDNVRAGAGDDIVFGGANRDKIYGQEGDDTLYGNGSNDRLYGGDGSDTIVGGAGDDVLYGDNPNDGGLLEGWSDTFVFGTNDGRDKILDFEQGIDVLLMEGGSAEDVSFAYKAGNTIISYGDTTVLVYDATLDVNDLTFA